MQNHEHEYQDYETSGSDTGNKNTGKLQDFEPRYARADCIIVRIIIMIARRRMI